LHECETINWCVYAFGEKIRFWILFEGDKSIKGD